MSLKFLPNKCKCQFFNYFPLSQIISILKYWNAISARDTFCSKTATYNEIMNSYLFHLISILFSLLKTRHDFGKRWGMSISKNLVKFGLTATISESLLNINTPKWWEFGIWAITFLMGFTIITYFWNINRFAFTVILSGLIQTSRATFSLSKFSLTIRWSLMLLKNGQRIKFSQCLGNYLFSEFLH